MSEQSEGDDKYEVEEEEERKMKKKEEEKKAQQVSTRERGKKFCSLEILLRRSQRALLVVGCALRDASGTIE